MDRTLLNRVGAYVLGACVVALAACDSVTDQFTCEVDGDCTLQSGDAGRCEGNQRCSYPDATCSSGFRFGDYAGPVSDGCTTGTGTDCAVSVSAGVHDSCASHADGTVGCWGNGVTTLVHPDMPPGTITQIDDGGAGLCARYDDGTIACSAGPKIGDVGLASATALSIGTTHMCAIANSGLAECWGTDTRGDIGDGKNMSTTQPSQVSTIFATLLIAAGLDSSCAMTGTGQLWCWGDNVRDQLGQGIAPIDSASTPVSVNVNAATIAISVGDRFACAAISDGSVLCWGDNTKGQIGQGGTGDTVDTPTKLSGLSGIEQLTSGGGHTCARDHGGQVFCWGENGSFESAGVGMVAVTHPTLVVDSNGQPILFADVDAGAKHTCGRTLDGAILCWGDNTDGQIGDGTFMNAAFPTRAALACQ